MLGFPQTTEFNKRIPKQKFYNALGVSPALKRVFSEQINLIRWRNKIAPSTVNIAPGQDVNEIELIEISLTQQSLDETVLRLIDREIPYHILFILSYGNKIQVWTGHKEVAASGRNPFKVNKYYHTEWMPENELSLKIQGLNMDSVWDNFIIQVSGIKLEHGKSLSEQIELDELKAKLKKNIEKLEKRSRTEKQPNKKFELAAQAKALRKQLEQTATTAQNIREP